MVMTTMTICHFLQMFSLQFLQFFTILSQRCLFSLERGSFKGNFLSVDTFYVWVYSQFNLRLQINFQCDKKYRIPWEKVENTMTGNWANIIIHFIWVIMTIFSNVMIIENDSYSDDNNVYYDKNGKIWKILVKWKRKKNKDKDEDKNVRETIFREAMLTLLYGTLPMFARYFHSHYYQHYLIAIIIISPSPFIALFSSSSSYWYAPPRH